MTDKRTLGWQAITLVTLFVGYVGYYICRSNLSIAAPLLLEEFRPIGLNKIHIGWIASSGVLLYAVGKITNGLSADFWGGRKLFICGMAASVVCTVLFPFAAKALLTMGFTVSLGLLILLWAANRYVQSMGWVSLVKVASRWYPVRVHATVMGILSMSFLLGDAFARFYLGAWIQYGAGWRTVFYVAAGSLGMIALVTIVALRDCPQDVGANEPPANPDNVYGAAGQVAGADSVWGLVIPLLTKPTFVLICVINFGVTLVRETFNTWTPTYLVEVGQMSGGDAAQWSLLFPLVGAAASLLAGGTSDLLGGKHGRVIVPMLVVLVVVLVAMGLAPAQGRPFLALGMLSFASFFLIGPYSFLSGVMALNFGGKKGSSTAAGLSDGTGYFGGMFSGVGVGTIAELYGWAWAFCALAAVAGLTAVAALAYWIRQETAGRSSRKPRA